VQAQFVSPAIFSLDTEGRLGVKTVSAENMVVFHTVDTIQATTEGVWVAGLPETARVITVGQGFVQAGETVKPVAEGTRDSDLPATREGAPAAGDVASTGRAG
jgi:multidrug efflux system membrane fusion protein